MYFTAHTYSQNKVNRIGTVTDDPLGMELLRLCTYYMCHVCMVMLWIWGLFIKVIRAYTFLSSSVSQCWGLNTRRKEFWGHMTIAAYLDFASVPAVSLSQLIWKIASDGFFSLSFNKAAVQCISTRQFVSILC